MLHLNIASFRDESPLLREASLSLALQEFSKLASLERPQLFKADETIYSEEDPASFVYQVSVGIVRTVLVTGDGKRAVRGFHVPLEIFGIESGPLCSSSAEAVCDTYLFRIERKRLERLATDDTAVARLVLSWLLFNKDQVSRRLVLLARGHAVEKLAYFLLDLASRVGVSQRLEISMGRSDIGDYLGLSSETVSRTFTTLRERGFIALDGRYVLLLDRQSLTALARW
jgi:CRP/FNR family nitrogen fixation transcriptional regulator